ncbi:MAG: FAD-binding oxidoreductase [Chloroflexi bacterium]|nr:FAD-binding oxidoreductase [Chloroflexota bacterium]
MSKQEAGAIIIGSGAWGASIAYHLARAGVQGVILLDRSDIGSQTSPRAAGLAPQLRAPDAVAAMGKESVQAFARFEQEVGQPLGFHPVGSIKIALTVAREKQLRDDIKRGKRLGLQVEFISLGDVRRMIPAFEPVGVRLAIYIHGDAYLDIPAQVPLGYAAAAQARGVRLMPHTEVTRVLVENGRVKGVATHQGEIQAPVVVDSAGAWTGLVAETVGISVPMVPVRHQLYITHPLPDMLPTQPCLRVHDASVYTRYAGGGLMIGGYESGPVSYDMKTLPSSFEIKDMPLDFGVLRRLTDGILPYFPALREATVQEHRGGLPTMTPDGNYLIGPVPGIANFYIATGCNVGGLSTAPAVGRIIAELVTEGRSSTDILPFAITRFADRYRPAAQGGAAENTARLRHEGEQVYAHAFSVNSGHF